MKKTIIRLRSKLGTILDVVKNRDEYQLVSQFGNVTASKKVTDDEGVRQMYEFVNGLITQGWKII